jgi:hypothetical protein
VRKLRFELWRQKNWLFHQDSAPSHTSFFTSKFFLPKTSLSHPPFALLAGLALCDLFLFHGLQIKLKGSDFDTINMLDAEGQTVLNTFTEQDFQDAF